MTCVCPTRAVVSLITRGSPTEIAEMRSMCLCAAVVSKSRLAILTKQVQSLESHKVCSSVRNCTLCTAILLFVS